MGISKVGQLAEWSRLEMSVGSGELLILDESALLIVSGAELERFDLGTVLVGRQSYTVLTGYEGTGRCFWCGGELKGKLKRYCYGHMKEYYRYFEWNSARHRCIERQDRRCANCGIHMDDMPNMGYREMQTSYRVHHIVPLNGSKWDFSAFNLPWNLIGLCHDCHLEIHAAMRPGPHVPKDRIEAARQVGQAIMEEVL